jgi:SAM-dependent methyltransferase
LREQHIRYLRCPSCYATLKLQESHSPDGQRIERGVLSCDVCRATFPILGYVPRFVPDEGYVEGFGLEWNLHRRTQYDRTSGLRLSETRFFEQTGWPRRLDGEVVLEAGSGSGRFTEPALSTGALVLSLDYSRAVDANYASNGHHDNLLLVQADLFHMPFPTDVADRLFCLGVLQHTPDPRLALQTLTRHLRPGGQLVADTYIKTFARYILGTKYWVRPLTRRMPPADLYRLTTRYVDFMWPIAKRLRRIPKLGRPLNWRLLIADYSDVISDDELLREWARLDTFDMLAARYDKPVRGKTVTRWCAAMGLESVSVHRGYNGLEIRARRPSLRSGGLGSGT